MQPAPVQPASLLLLLLLATTLQAAQVQLAPQVFPEDSLSYMIPEDWSEWPVKAIRFSGLEVTREEALRRELEMETGDLYSDAALVQDGNNLKNTRLFARLVVTVTPDTLDHSVDVIYAMRERPRFLFLPLLVPGDEVDQWSYGAGVLQRNLGGMGRQLAASGKTGYARSVELRYVEPWFLGRRQRLALFAEHHERPVTRIEEGRRQEFERRSTLLGTRIEPFLDPRFSVYLEPAWYRLEAGRFNNEPTTVHPAGRDQFFSCAFGSVLNTTDIHINPRRGGRFYADAWFFGLAGKRQPQGSRFTVGLSRYKDLGPLVLGAYAGAASFLGDPARRAEYMKLTLGGHPLVRGVENGALTGWTRWIGKLEGRFPLLPKRILFQRWDLEVGGVLFADGGQTWQTDMEGSKGFRGALGAGLRFFVPYVDVLSADLAWGSDAGLLFYVKTGQSF